VYKEKIHHPGELLLFDKKHSMVSGITLKEIQALGITDFEIKYQWQPARLVPNTMNKYVKDLWNNKK
jgi:hypothetical protein